MNNGNARRRVSALIVMSFLALVFTTEAFAREPRRLVLCLDGTWNSTFSENVRVDGTKVLRPTNTLKTCRAVFPRADREQITYYENGVGALAEYPGTANRILRFTDRILGGAYGAGFEANIESAVHFLQLNYEEGDEVYIFGFSRGAATARGVTRFLEWNGGVLAKDDAYYMPRFFRAYITSHAEEGGRDRLRDEINADRANEKVEASRRPLHEFRPVNIRYLGVWDTVMSLGSRFRAKGASTSAPGRSFHAGTSPALGVAHARQALAVDEQRFDFRPEVWIEKKDGQKVEQRWFAGVHSNVGGGYRNDGLANLALKWILEGAMEEDLKLDKDYLKFFGTSPKAVLYDSSSTLYRFLDTIRFRRGKGKRPINGINADLDTSVLERMMADASALTRDPVKGAKNTKEGPYRPDNVIQYLAAQPDLDAYLRTHNLTADALPADVRSRIASLASHNSPPAPRSSH